MFFHHLVKGIVLILPWGCRFGLRCYFIVHFCMCTHLYLYPAFVVFLITNMKYAGVLFGLQPEITHENTFTRKLSHLPIPRLWKEICSWVQVKESYCISPRKGWCYFLAVTILQYQRLFSIFLCYFRYFSCFFCCILS